MQEELQTDLVHLVGLGERERLSNETSQALAQGVVPALHVCQLPASLAHRLVALLRNHRPVCLPEIAVARSTFVAFGDPPPQPAAGSLAAVAHDVGDHLTSVARLGDPYPAFARPLADEGPQLVEFEHEVFGRRRGGRQGSRQRRQASGFFLSQRVTVLRETPKVRARPLREERSW